MSRISWANLPPEIISLIADDLRLIELLGLRGVCKDWRSASSTASAKFECEPDAKPYFLLQSDDGNCTLYDHEKKKKYNINIPELKDTTCLASNQGWLLLFQEGSIFFFCPFSRARIDLPKFPHSEISDHVAAFTSPFSPDCIISVINRSDEHKVELNVLRRGAETWTKHELNREATEFGPVTCATYDNKGTFYYVDGKRSALTFKTYEKSWLQYRIVDSKVNSVAEKLPFGYDEKYSDKIDLRKCLDIEDDAIISTCGAVLQDCRCEFLISNENLQGLNESTGRKLKGIWIQPRFYHLSPNQIW